MQSTYFLHTIYPRFVLFAFAYPFLLHSPRYNRRKEKGPINFQAMVPQSTLTHELVAALCRGEESVGVCTCFIGLYVQNTNGHQKSETEPANPCLELV